MQKTAIFPGSFDPITRGHQEIVLRGLHLFDEILVAVGINEKKKPLFALEERLEMVRTCFAAHERISVASYQELTVEFARRNECRFILRGLRTPQDFHYEQPIEFVNKHMAPELESVHLISSPETAHISSTIVREVIKYGGKVEGLLPDETLAYVMRKREEKETVGS